MCHPSRQHRIDQLRKLPLEPAEYCRRWVKADPGKGYRKVCVNALAEATGLDSGTIRNWGSNFERRPRYVLHVLRQADLLNQIRELEQTEHLYIPENLLRE